MDLNILFSTRQIYSCIVIHSTANNCLQVSARIEKLIAEKQLYAAVQLHVHSALMLEREGLQVVSSLPIQNICVLSLRRAGMLVIIFYFSLFYFFNFSFLLN